ncbi:MAG: tripartite tricarboxylate transporter TctB family protein [Acidobacteria bacterium]|nr:tripartite tricarboxylate transporter TctB family protein [Acidobacteriota bacterium]
MPDAPHRCPRSAKHARAALFAVAIAALTVIGETPVQAQEPYPHLRLIAPAAPGGGWDQTARAMQLALTQAGLAQAASVENVPGAAGTIGLARFVSAERGNGDVAMVSGLIMLAAITTHRSAITLGDVTPIARLTGEFEVIVVPSTSPHRTLADLLAAFRAAPESVSWGGGSAGGSDQILAGLIADASGVDPRRVNYIAFAGGGESLAAVTGGQVTAGISGVSEFAPQIEAGTVRVLAVSSAERLPHLDAPTLREQGIDVELEIWRSVVAPPGVSPADRDRLLRTIDAMVHSEPWRQMVSRYRWNDRYLAGDAFAAFLDSEEARVLAVLRKLGTGDAAVLSLASAGPYPVFVLGGLGLCSLAFAASLRRSRRDLAPSHDAASSPAASGGAVPAAHAPASATATGRRTMALVVAGIVLDLLLMDRAGFVIASSVCFWLTARAFDAAHPLRDAGFAIVVSIASYLLFVRMLQLSLPAGMLAGWL